MSAVTHVTETELNGEPADLEPQGEILSPAAHSLASDPSAFTPHATLMSHSGGGVPRSVRPSPGGERRASRALSPCPRRLVLFETEEAKRSPVWLF